MNLNEFLTNTGFFAKYPYTDFHEMNLDWAIKEIAQLRVEFDDFAHVNSLKYAGEWDITKSYSAFSVVDDQGFGYMALKPVPPGTQINDTEYWLMVVDYSQITQDYENRISALETTVGDASSGLIKDVDDLQTDMTNAQNDIGTLQNDVGTLQNTVGDASSGLIKDVDDLQTDMTNAQNDIINIQNTIGDASSGMIKDVDDLQIGVANVNERVDLLTLPRRVIVVADSYAEGLGGQTPFTNTLQSYFGLTNADYFALIEGGMGFYTPGTQAHTALQLLVLNESNITDHDTITDIIFTLGINDRASTLSGIDAHESAVALAIANTIGYCKTKYPNAHIYLGYVGNVAIKTMDPTIEYAMSVKTQIDASKQAGVDYIHGIEYIMHYPAYSLADYLHPTTVAGDVIAKYIYGYVNGNNSGDFISRFHSTSGFTTTGSMNLSSVLFDTHYNNSIGAASISGYLYGDMSGYDWIKLGAFSDKSELAFFCNAYTPIIFDTKVFDSTAQEFKQIKIKYENGELYVNPLTNTEVIHAGGSFFPAKATCEMLYN